MAQFEKKTKQRTSFKCEVSSGLELLQQPSVSPPCQDSSPYSLGVKYCAVLRQITGVFVHVIDSTDAMHRGDVAVTNVGFILTKRHLFKQKNNNCVLYTPV